MSLVLYPPTLQTARENAVTGLLDQQAHILPISGRKHAPLYGKTEP